MFEGTEQVMIVTGMAAGVLAFLFLVLFEIFKCRACVKNKQSANPFFIIGLILLIAGWAVMCIGAKPAFSFLSVIGGVITATGIVLYVIVLAQVSKGETYTKNAAKNAVSRTGAYRVVRHPGLWCFIVVAAGAACVAPRAIWGDILFVILNIDYIILQDTIFFNTYLEGYQEYRQQVPFCFPHLRGDRK